MEAILQLERNMRIVGKTPLGHETAFDTSPAVGGENSAPSPMQVMLQAMAACSFMDVLSILRKKRKQIDGLSIKVEGERTDEHPKIFQTVHLVYELSSPNCEIKDLERSVELSQAKYCGASAMFKLAGCKVTWECVINR